MGNEHKTCNRSETIAKDRCCCFINDKGVKATHIVRYTQSKWRWSTSHETALISSLSSANCRIPMEIIHLIKHHSYDESEPYYTMNVKVNDEKYYYPYSQLLHKHLCHSWYSSQENTFMTDSLLIGIHSHNEADIDHIFQCLSAESLPALELQSKPYMDKYEQIRRTIYVNQCPIKLHVIGINSKHYLNNDNNTNNDNMDVLQHPMINMIVLKEYDPLSVTNKMCQMLWNQKESIKNCIIVKIKLTQKRKGVIANSVAIDELAKYWNVPCIDIYFEDGQTLDDLWRFAVKYYWFCHVVQ